jgi:hypothetical protein
LKGRLGTVDLLIKVSRFITKVNNIFNIEMSNEQYQCYKTFYGRKLHIFVKARVFAPGKLFRPSVLFVSKARNLP